MQPLEKAETVIREGISQQLHPGAQLYVSWRGEVLADSAFGEARLGVPMEKDTILLWLSSGKPLTAMAVAQLWEQGRLKLDDPVRHFIPEFAQGGKEAITVRHLLTHTAGIRSAEKCDLGASWPEIISCICETPIELHWVPGEQAGYDPSAGWYVLGEIIRRIDGRPPEQYVREEVFGRCGMDHSWLALPPDQFQQQGDRLGVIYHTETGSPKPHRRWNTATDSAVCRPGRTGRGPARELGLFYEKLLQIGHGDAGAGGSDSGRQLVRPNTVREFTRRHRVGMFDDTFQQVLDWGLGFLLDSKRYGREMLSYGYGRFASDGTFGHGGAQSSGAFADPAYGLVVAWVFNGMPGERQHRHRAHALNTAIYEDLAEKIGIKR